MGRQKVIDLSSSLPRPNWMLAQQLPVCSRCCLSYCNTVSSGCWVRCEWTLPNDNASCGVLRVKLDRS